MPKRHVEHEYRRIPLERIPQIELMQALALRNPMHGFLEVDVTDVRREIRARRERTGEGLSFTGFVIACLARAVSENPQVQAFRRRRRLVVFGAVDVATLVEVESLEGEPVPLPYVVRDAASKTLRQVHEEIRAAQADRTLAPRMRKQVALLGWVPYPLRWVLWRLLATSPRMRKRFGGTVVVSSVGMFGKGPAWGLSLVGYPVTLTVGGVVPRAVIRNGVLEEREYLCLTVSLDHEVVDGAVAARFIARLRNLMETRCGIDLEDDLAANAVVDGR